MSKFVTWIFLAGCSSFEMVWDYSKWSTGLISHPIHPIYSRHGATSIILCQRCYTSIYLWWPCLLLNEGEIFEEDWIATGGWENQIGFPEEGEEHLCNHSNSENRHIILPYHNSYLSLYDWYVKLNISLEPSCHFLSKGEVGPNHTPQWIDWSLPATW